MYIHNLNVQLDQQMAIDIVLNAKTRRVSIWNTLVCLTVHEAWLENLGEIIAPLADKKVEIFANKKATRGNFYLGTRRSILVPNFCL